jgi:FHA domain-containing protein
MITLTVTSFNGKPVDNLAVQFDELGGTIGRAETNQLVLPDPERAISRVHAQVVFRSGGFALIGRGGNAVILNGGALGHGVEASLKDGDQIQMGTYRMAASTKVVAAIVDPFESAFGNPNAATLSVSAPPAARPVGSAQMPVAPPRQPAGLPVAKPAASGIPDDWDPFADAGGGNAFDSILSGGSPAPAQPFPPQTSSLGSKQLVPQMSNEESLDDLFGLSGGSGGIDKFSASPLGSIAPAPNTSGNLDPMRALAGGGKEIVRDVVGDHVSDLNSPWANSPAPARPNPANAAPALAGAVLSWAPNTKTEGAPSTVALPKPVRKPDPVAAPLLDGLSASRPAEAVAIPALRPIGPPIERSNVNPAAGAGAASHQELLDALREGLGVADLRLPGMTPDLMRQTGQLLREATRGTVELLAARSALKREVKAEVTMIIAKANNSLKFSPSVEVAIQYLMGPKMSGFLPPVESMRDAYDDLRAHQLGVMAGMKAALSGVLERFDPAVLEGKLSGRSALSNLIPATRKARLWELFQELYQQLAHEAAEDFDALFGKSFLRAYEQYIDEIARANNANKKK